MVLWSTLQGLNYGAIVWFFFPPKKPKKEKNNFLQQTFAFSHFESKERDFEIALNSKLYVNNDA